MSVLHQCTLTCNIVHTVANRSECECLVCLYVLVEKTFCVLNWIWLWFSIVAKFNQNKLSKIIKGVYWKNSTTVARRQNSLGWLYVLIRKFHNVLSDICNLTFSSAPCQNEHAHCWRQHGSLHLNPDGPDSYCVGDKTGFRSDIHQKHHQSEKKNIL